MLAKALLFLLLLKVAIGATPGENGKSRIRKQINEMKADSYKEVDDALQSRYQIVSYLSDIYVEGDMELTTAAGAQYDRLREQAKNFTEYALGDNRPLELYECISTLKFKTNLKISKLLQEYRTKLYEMSKDNDETLEKCLEDIKLINASIEGSYRRPLDSLNVCKYPDCENNAVMQARIISINIKKHLERTIKVIKPLRENFSRKKISNSLHGVLSIDSTSRTATNRMRHCYEACTNATPTGTSCTSKLPHYFWN